MIDVASLVDVKNGTQAKSIFWDEQIYQLELERIFDRCWLFLTHDSLIPNPGDFTTAVMGEDEVIIIRQMNGSVKAFLNVCAHRGTRVCSVEAGNTRSFTCTYHGWSYGLDGSLQAVPFENEFYKGVLDKSTHGLIEVRAESYMGFWYGNFDKTAPSLYDYLGDYRFYLDVWMDSTGGAELIGPPTRTLLNCNWKTPAENFVGDAYHVGWTHAASLSVLGGELSALSGNKMVPPDGAGTQITTRFGHGLGILTNAGPALLSGPAGDLARKWYAENRPKVAEKLGKTRGGYYGSHFNSNVFPNNSYLWGTNTFKVWAPRGPRSIEVFTWGIVEKNMPDEVKEAVYDMATRTFGTAGMLEGDDADNMESMTQLNRGRQIRKGRLNSQMGMGGDKVDEESGAIIGASAVGETSYRGYYRAYREFLMAESWDELLSADPDAWKREFLGK
ncbi:MAG TPA: aromatic ring-hydroxylating dioxygenase subunit alpha [Rugosibacter sp.]